DPTLSLDLRRRLALSLYGPVLRKVPIFRDVKSMYLKCLCQRVVVRLYTPGDLLVLIGEVGSELFIIMSGKVEPVGEDGRPIRDIVMGEGQYFGEICFLHPGTRRTASVRCVEFCQTIVLTLETFDQLQMTEVLDAIRSQSHDMQKAYVKPELPNACTGLDTDDDKDAEPGAGDEAEGPAVPGRLPGSPAEAQGGAGPAEGQLRTVASGQVSIVKPLPIFIPRDMIAS
ncbi:unnamed protein product, partial [Prorocentrum cordatum]